MAAGALGVETVSMSDMVGLVVEMDRKGRMRGTATRVAAEARTRGDDAVDLRLRAAAAISM
jgi:redox-regulated HSP33 family molecular chaperone